MKRLLTFVCVVVLFLCSVISVGAQGNAEFTLDVDNVKSNRLFDISVCARCDSAISGAELKLTYDSSVVEYRDVSSEYFEIQAKDYGDKLHIVFGSASAMKPSSKTKLFSISFKSVAQGEFDAQLDVTGCIDDKLQSIDIQSSVTTITVDNDTVTATSKSGSSNKTPYKSSVKKSQIRQSDSTESKTSYSIETIKDDLDTDRAIWYGACAGLVVVLSFALGMIFRKKVDSDSNNKDKKE